MKHFSLSSSCWLLSGASVLLLPNSFLASAAAFFPSSSSHQSRLFTTHNTGSPPSISPGQATTTPIMAPISPPLTRRRYANDQTSSSSSELTAASPPPTTMHVIATAEKRRQEWINSSVNYYTKVMREERRRRLGQAPEALHVTPQYKDDFNILATKHYFALRKIKDGKAHHAELIYRRIIGELQQDVDCDNAKLAVTTLLLALLLQRVGSAKQTRSVFLNFFRVAMLSHDSSSSSSSSKNVFTNDSSSDGVHEHEQCACSAKVMQAYALFEMKQGNSLKSLQLVQKAIQLDPSLQPVLNWKQFRDAASANKRYM